MSSIEPGRRQDSPLAQALLPYHVIGDFLAADLVARLLDHARTMQGAFRATRVNARIDSATWNSLTTHDLGTLGAPLTERMLAAAPILFAALKMEPFEIAKVELELIAYKDGAFSKTHVDLVTRSDAGRVTYRAISAAYYFHAEPKGFTGGALRFHPAMADEPGAGFADVEPVNNTLVAFPAFAPHEVLPVRCPSGAFMDSRFTVYFGLHRARA